MTGEQLAEQRPPRGQGLAGFALAVQQDGPCAGGLGFAQCSQRAAHLRLVLVQDIGDVGSEACRVGPAAGDPVGGGGEELAQLVGVRAGPRYAALAAVSALTPGSPTASGAAAAASRQVRGLSVTNCAVPG